MAAGSLQLYGLPPPGPKARSSYPRPAENLGLEPRGMRHSLRQTPGRRDAAPVSRHDLRALLETRARHRRSRRPGRRAGRGRRRCRGLLGLSGARRSTGGRAHLPRRRGDGRFRSAEFRPRRRAVLGPRASARHPGDAGGMSGESCPGWWALLSSAGAYEGALMVQIAEQATAPETIEATLTYFVDTEIMPVSLVGAPGGSDQRVGGGKPDPHRVVMRNGRLETDRFALERNGFRFVRHDTRVVDFFDEEEVRRVYYPEMEALVKAESGASRVAVFDHTLRETRKIREVVRRVHNDYTEWSGPQRVRTFLPEEADALLSRRFAII